MNVWRMGVATTFVGYQLILFICLQGIRWPQILAGVLLVMPWLHERVRISRAAQTAILVGCGAIFLLLGAARFAARNPLLDLFGLFAQYLLLVQGTELLRQRKEDDVNFLPGLGTLAFVLLILSLDFPLSTRTLETICLAFCGGLFLTLRPDWLKLLWSTHRDRKKAVLLGVSLALALSLGKYSQNEILQTLPQARALLSRVQSLDDRQAVLASVNARFVQQVTLNSIARTQLLNPDEPVFSVESDLAPGYMKTLSFDRFNGSQWLNSHEMESDSRYLPPELPSPREENYVELSALEEIRASVFDTQRETTS